MDTPGIATTPGTANPASPEGGVGDPFGEAPAAVASERGVVPGTEPSAEGVSDGESVVLSGAALIPSATSAAGLDIVPRTSPDAEAPVLLRSFGGREGGGSGAGPCAGRGDGAALAGGSVSGGALVDAPGALMVHRLM
jgi:hypothetical protein